MQLVSNAWIKYVGEQPIISAPDSENSWRNTPCRMAAVEFHHCLSYAFVRFSHSQEFSVWYEEEFMQFTDEAAPTCIAKHIYVKIPVGEAITLTMGNHAFQAERLLSHQFSVDTWFKFSIYLAGQVRNTQEEPANVPPDLNL